MKIYLAGSENQCLLDYVIPNKIHTYNHLFSYYYISKKNILNEYLKFRDLSDLILIDSGAHTFHTAQNIDFEKYTYDYADFIKKTDNPKVTGYFEMDIDNRIGYKKVLKLREILDDISDKIIPVWHKNRGFKNYKKMCRNYDYVSISCLPIEGIPNKDLIKFVNVAHDNGSKIHGLGGTRTWILKNIPFDSVDGATWVFKSAFGWWGKDFIKDGTLTTCEKMQLHYLDWRKKQKFYEDYWRIKRRR